MPTPSSSNSPTRARRATAVTSVLSVIAVGAVVALVVAAGLPESWWPRTGAAFAPEPSSSSARRQDPCEVIVGPAQAYCERGITASFSSSASAGQDLAGAAWRLMPAGTGVAAVVIWRRRSSLARERG